MKISRVMAAVFAFRHFWYAGRRLGPGETRPPEKSRFSGLFDQGIRGGRFGNFTRQLLP